MGVFRRSRAVGGGGGSTKGQKGGGGGSGRYVGVGVLNYTFCQILIKNRGRNAFSSFLLTYRGRNKNFFSRDLKKRGGGGVSEWQSMYVVTFI